MRTFFVGLCAAALACVPSSADPFKATLVSGPPSPQAVGNPILLVAHPENAGKVQPTFRYSVSVADGPFQIVRDFSRDNLFVWIPALYEHHARVRVSVRAGDQSAEAELPFEVVSRVHGNSSVVTATANPLVALFSAPPCPDGSQFQVAFRPLKVDTVSHTSAQACGGHSQNVYVAGMRQDSVYQMRPEVTQDGKVTAGEWSEFHTGLLDGSFPRVTIPVPRSADSAVAEPLIVRSLTAPWRPTATDQAGNVVWFTPQIGMLSRMLPGGRFLELIDGTNSANDMRRLQLLRETDLAGNTLRETNISRVAEQLDHYGIHSTCEKGGKECVPGFHHEAIRLPNGHTVVLTGMERMLPAGTQGATAPVDVLGDLIVDLDEDLQVAWVWNSFDHMDLKREGLGKGKCKGGPGNDGCTPVFLADAANEWLHSNALFYDRSSGDLLMSIPEQDWVIKIDYGNGKGSGKVLWKLGKDGDFTVDSKDPYPWFSYQHDAGFESAGSNLLVLFDDGHRRKEKFPNANNRGQVWKLDEKAKTASLLYNVDVGVYSVAVGSAQKLSNGDYSFEAGFINPPYLYSRTIETSPDDQVLFAQQLADTLTYRSFRVRDLYSPPAK